MPPMPPMPPLAGLRPQQTPHTHGPLPPPPPPLSSFYTHPQPPMFVPPPPGPPPTRWHSGWSGRQGRQYPTPPTHTATDLFTPGNPWMNDFPRTSTAQQDESAPDPPVASERPASPPVPVIRVQPGDIVQPTESPDRRPSGPGHTVSPHERKAQLEAAKEYYKAEKEKWRKEREERRKERRAMEERKLDDSGDNAPARNESTPRPLRPSIRVEGVAGESGVPGPSRARPSPFAQIVSNPRGPYPQLEMFGLPRRHHSHHSHRAFPAQDIATPEQRDTAKLGQRVTKRLHDMGFTETAYPILNQILPDYLRPNGVPTKDTEDAIITKMLETLLQISPRPAHASSSGAKRERDIPIPGAWH